jgi:hypothetical protein
MAWKDLISGSFGFGTAQFAAYAADWISRAGG